MKTTGVCIKCGSDRVVSFEEKSGYNNATTTSAFHVAVATRFVCCDCGYFEEYYLNSDDLERMYAKFR